MPRGGSRKGERRGNARKKDTILQTPAEIMEEAVALRAGGPNGGRGPDRKAVERRLAVAQVIFGNDDTDDMTPKDMMLENARYLMKAVRAYEAMLSSLLAQPEQTDDTRRDILHCEREIERLRDKATDHAYRVSPLMHPRLAAVQVRGDQGATPGDVLDALFDDIDDKYRASPIIDLQAKRIEKKSA